MARSKQHPDIGKFTASYAGHVEGGYDVDTFDTAEEALESYRRQAADGIYDDGDVIYVYAIVGVKTIRKPTLTENVPA